MLSADPDFEIRANAPTGRYGESNQFAYPILIQNLEGIVR